MLLSLAFCLFVCGHAPGPPAYLERAAKIFNGDARSDDFLHRLSREEALRDFQPLLKSEKPDTSAYIVSAFALDMKGVDPAGNLDRMIGPLKHSGGQIEHIWESGGLAKDEILPEDIPTALYTVYKARHDNAALRALFTTPIEGAVAENRDDDVMDAMAHSPTEVLRLAAQSAVIYSKLWDIIDWNVGTMSDRRAFVRRLKAGRWPNAEIRRTALRLANDLGTPKHRPVSPSGR